MDVAQSEKVEGELDIFIERRERERRKSEGDRRAEELWMESERVYFARRQEDNRIAWCEYRRHMRDLHWRLGNEHDAELKKLENGHHREEGENGHLPGDE